MAGSLSDCTQILLQKAPDLSEVAKRQKWEILFAKTAWKQTGGKLQSRIKSSHFPLRQRRQQFSQIGTSKTENRWHRILFFWKLQPEWRQLALFLWRYKGKLILKYHQKPIRTCQIIQKKLNQNTIVGTIWSIYQTEDSTALLPFKFPSEFKDLTVKRMWLIRKNYPEFLSNISFLWNRLALHHLWG